MKVSTEIDNNFGYEKITQLVDNIPLTTNLTLRDFSGIIEHFPVRGHIQGCGSTTL